MRYGVRGGARVLLSPNHRACPPCQKPKVIHDRPEGSHSRIHHAQPPQTIRGEVKEGTLPDVDAYLEAAAQRLREKAVHPTTPWALGAT